MPLLSQMGGQYLLEHLENRRTDSNVCRSIGCDVDRNVSLAGLQKKGHNRPLLLINAPEILATIVVARRRGKVTLEAIGWGHIAPALFFHWAIISIAHSDVGHGCPCRGLAKKKATLFAEKRMTGDNIEHGCNPIVAAKTVLRETPECLVALVNQVLMRGHFS